MTSYFNSPYNITITDDSPVVSYHPYRDGLLTTGWNSTCADSLDSTWNTADFCVGPSSHRSSFIGATLTINFEGTAIYLYGNAPSDSYAISVDDQTNTTFTSSRVSSGLLGKGVGMAFDKHTLVLSITQPNLVSFSQAIVTVGVGRGDSTNNIQNRALNAYVMEATGHLSLNPQFSYTGTRWTSFVPGLIGPGDVAYPMRYNDAAGDSMTFTISKASAIFVYSLTDKFSGQFSVTFTPPSELGQPVTTVYDAYSHWLRLDRLLFWAASMDRDKDYTVKITNLATAGTPWLGFSHVDILDAISVGPAPTSTAADVPKVNCSTPINAIVGGTIGGFITGILLTICFLFYLRRKRTTENGDSTGRGPGRSQHDGSE